MPAGSAMDQFVLQYINIECLLGGLGAFDQLMQPGSFEAHFKRLELLTTPWPDVVQVTF